MNNKSTVWQSIIVGLSAAVGYFVSRDLHIVAKAILPIIAILSGFYLSNRIEKFSILLKIVVSFFLLCLIAIAGYISKQYSLSNMHSKNSKVTGLEYKHSALVNVLTGKWKTVDSSEDINAKITEYYIFISTGDTLKNVSYKYIINNKAINLIGTSNNDSMTWNIVRLDKDTLTIEINNSYLSFVKIY